MGTTIYGSYDQLVIEVDGMDAWRMWSLRPLRVRVAIDDILSVTLDGARDPAATTSDLHVGNPRLPGAALALVDGSRIVVHRRDAADVVNDLVRRGVVAKRRELSFSG